MTWRNCVASVILIDEVNTRWPSRDKDTDGTIGDEAHASRKSDHNPFIKDANGIGVVRARDIDEDLNGNKADNGADASELLNHLLALARKGDRRLCGGGYIIYQGYIYSERTDWKPARYYGANQHDKHLHVSFSLDPDGYDSDEPWGLLDNSRPLPTMRLNDRGALAWFIAALLNDLARAGLVLDDKNRPVTSQLTLPTADKDRQAYLYDRALQLRVAGFQRFLHNLWVYTGSKGPEPKIDGVAGPYTMRAIQFWLPIAQQKIAA